MWGYIISCIVAVTVAVVISLCSKARSCATISCAKNCTDPDLELEKLFHEYCDEADQELMSSESISKFFASPLLSITSESDIRALVLLWRFGAKSKPGCITKAEFIRGMQTIHAYSEVSLGKKISEGFAELDRVDKDSFRGTVIFLL